MRNKLPLLLVVVLIAASAVAAAPARAADSPAAIAREILGHAPRGLAQTVVERGYVRVANDSNYRPFSSVDTDSARLVGFDVDYARAVGEILGLEVRFKNPAWSWVPRGLVSARYFEVSIGGLKNTWKNRRTLAFTRAYYHLAAKVLIRRGGPAVTGVESLAGRRVAAQSGTYLRFLERKTGARAVQYLHWQDARAALLRRDVPMWLLSAVTAGRLAREDDRLQVIGPALFWDRCAVAVRRGEDDLVELLDFAVRRLKDDGTTQALIVKWFGAGDQGIRP